MENRLKDIKEYLKGNRVKHSISAHINIQAYARGVEESDFKQLTSAALYHDIGYNAEIARKGSHYALDGYLYVKEKVSPLIGYLILNHSGAKDLMPEGVREEFKREHEAVEKRLRGLGYTEEKLRHYVDLVTLADYITMFNGKRVTVGERLNDIGERFGKNSIEYSVMSKEIQRIGEFKGYDFESKKTVLQRQ